MNSWFHRIAKIVGYPFRYKISGLENIVPDQPRIFISNHAGSLGPIAIYISLPVQLHPWVIAEMTDVARTADYLYDDFIRPAWHLNGRLGRTISRWLAPVAVRVIRGFKPISIDRNRGWCREAFLESNALLLSGKSLLIFPENPVDEDHAPGEIRSFQGGFCWLTHMYQKSVGEPLVIQPMAVNSRKRSMVLGKAITIDLDNDYRKSINAAAHNLESVVRDLYRSIKQ
jgi:1-acyl-sn-glycerol-3-phosphate acyltransferase